jgi:hypothetical protein
MMTVIQLRALLSEFPDDAEVLILTSTGMDEDPESLSIEDGTVFIQCDVTDDEDDEVDGVVAEGDEG